MGYDGLFRGKHIHAMSGNSHLDGTWMYGYLADFCYINTGDGEFLVEEESVGQYTRVRDMYYKKIFTKDLIKIKGCNYVFEVLRVNDRFVGVDLCSNEIVDLYNNAFSISIIGNRFDMSKEEYFKLVADCELEHHPFKKFIGRIVTWRRKKILSNKPK